MKQRVFCRACGEHYFDYDGDVRDGAMQSEKATLPDGSRPPPNTAMIPPCGHVVHSPEKDLRVETLPTDREPEQLSLLL